MDLEFCDFLSLMMCLYESVIAIRICDLGLAYNTTLGTTAPNDVPFTFCNVGQCISRCLFQVFSSLNYTSVLSAVFADSFSLVKMAFLYSLFIFKSLIFETTAQSCWRNTICTGRTAPSFSGPWDRYNYSPSSRTVSPTRILINGNIPVSDFPGPANYQENGSFLIFDFGKEVGGIVTIKYNASTTGKVGLAFSETTNYTGLWSDDSNGSYKPDGAIYGDLATSTNGSYTMPDAKFRGGFRYLTIFVTTTEPTIEFNITDVTLEIGYQPAWSNLQAYGGYFYSDDELLNKIWYSGAYTLQTTAAPANTGRAWPILNSGWANDMNLGTNGSTAYVDGAKRDRTLWSGDLAVAVPSILVSLGDVDGVRSTLEALYNVQVSGPELPLPQLLTETP